MAKKSDPTLAKIDVDLTQTKAFDAASYEQENVHHVYDAIASHFSDTRYKPWPLIPAFFSSLPKGAVGADLGCGNGKYLRIHSILSGSGDLLTVGMDRSANLIDLALTNFAPQAEDVSRGERRRQEVAVGDAICSNYRSRAFDYAISIATIHHFATVERRRQAVEEIIRIIRPISKGDKANIAAADVERGSILPYAGLSRGSGRFLIVVWALEQRGESRRRFEDVNDAKSEQSSSPTGQDLLVPWILRGQRTNDSEDATEKEESRIYQRFYHVFEQGELEALVQSAAQRFHDDIEVCHETGGWEKGNWYGIWRCIER